MDLWIRSQVREMLCKAECGCEFEIESGDVIYNKMWVQSIDKPYEYITKISTTCPFCNNEIDIKKKECRNEH